jgi:molybdopterin-guanine dinucleotide biosynthesis protein A
MLDPSGSASLPSSVTIPRGSLVGARVPVTGVVLAGGRSRRMGRDKALVRIGGRTLVERVSETLASACGRVIVAAGDMRALSVLALPAGTRVVADEVAHQGPLGGLATALAEMRTEWAFVAGVDMPFLREEVVRALWAELLRVERANPSRRFDVLMPVGEKGPEPLLALYRRSCRSAIREMLAVGERRVSALHSRVAVCEVPVGLLQAADPELVSLVNVNTAEDLARAERLATAGERP